MNGVNEAQQTVPPSEQTPAPEKLVIKNNTGERSVLAKWLRGGAIAARIVFFIACGAAAIILERLLGLLKPADGDHARSLSTPSDGRKVRGGPERIKVPVFPIDNYNHLDASQVMSRLAGLSREQLGMIRSHEARQKNRGDVLEAIDRQLADGR
ncbi:MAG TPA: hypothetical protein VMN77_12370 [Nitrospiria bacterium]|nr:hypothetical protein [Nitrospiria bacterium]